MPVGLDHQNPVIVAGAGIGGLSVALTLHQIGVPCLVFESVREPQPVGVGINLQPNAVRELFDLGFDTSALDQIGVRTEEWALVGRNGQDVYSEPRGLSAGYHWPQYSVHRGQLQMLLYEAALQRLGHEAIVTGARVLEYAIDETGVTVRVQQAGETRDHRASLLVGADGLHSAVRAQMYPGEGPVHWSGAIMWRGTTEAVPVRTGASFVGFGAHDKRIVFYPISAADPATGLATINWIAEITVDAADGVRDGDWSKEVALEVFAHHFEDWDYDWLDVPALLAGADRIFEYPMIDRDPVPTWVSNRVALLGDAAHVMYPTGSNGASQAIVDARVLGAELVAHSVSARALAAYDARLCAEVSAVVLRNRDAGPFGLLNLLDERCGGVFDEIETVLPRAEREAFMDRYRKAAGFAMESLNAAAPTIAPGASVGG